jgi:hypothetical protein
MIRAKGISAMLPQEVNHLASPAGGKYSGRKRCISTVIHRIDLCACCQQNLSHVDCPFLCRKMKSRPSALVDCIHGKV